jgi:hypothetical protein
LLILAYAVVGHSRFPGCTSLDQVTSMEKNPRPMFVVLRHEMVLEPGWDVCYRDSDHGSHELQALQPRIHLSLL